MTISISTFEIKFTDNTSMMVLERTEKLKERASKHPSIKDYFEYSIGKSISTIKKV